MFLNAHFSLLHVCSLALVLVAAQSIHPKDTAQLVGACCRQGPRSRGPTSLSGTVQHTTVHAWLHASVSHRHWQLLIALCLVRLLWHCGAVLTCSWCCKHDTDNHATANLQTTLLSKATLHNSQPAGRQHLLALFLYSQM